MSFTVVQVAQRSPEWRAARAGRLTGSVAHAAVAKGKGSAEAVTRRDLRFQLALERILGEPLEDDYVGADMRRGIDLEPAAIAAYEAAIGRRVERTGFLAHNELAIGCSLDGHLGNFDRLLEVKVAKPALQIRRCCDRASFIAEHWQQIAHVVWVTDAPAVDLVSFCPVMPPRLRLLVVPVPRHEAHLDEYAPAATAFLADVDRTVREIKALHEAAA